MKKIIIPLIAFVSLFSITACKKKSDTKSKDTTKVTTKVTTKNNTTSNVTTVIYKQPIMLNLNFKDYNTYYVDEKYIGNHEVDEINKECFPFDLEYELFIFKGWAYEGTLIFDESGNKVNDFEELSYMQFDVVFDPIDELKLFDYSTGMGYHTFDIWGILDDSAENLASLKSVYVPYEVTWNATTYSIYRFRSQVSKPGGSLIGVNNIEDLTIPFANGICSSGFLSSHFGGLWGGKEFENSYAVVGYYLQTNQTSEYTEHTYYIPKSLKRLKITGDLIAAYTFSNYNQLKDVEFIVTSNMKYVYNNAFYGITEQLTIYFEGTISEFNSISVNNTGNDAWNNANVYFYSEDDPGDGGSYSYFHYDSNGNIVIW